MVDVTVTYRRRNNDYFEKESTPGDYPYTGGEGYSLDVTPRAGKETLEEGENDISFADAFPEGTEYVVWAYAYDDNNNRVGSYIVEESDGKDGTETRFTIYVAKACNLRYVATPIK
jgi:hypothetical protein